MSRTYDRETKTYDFALLTQLVETGQATFFDGPGIYVIKTEDGTVAVRPHQVTFTATPAPFTLIVEETVVSPMDGYSAKEDYDGEDTGPGGVVYDSALALAERVLARRGSSTDPLILVRRILDDRSYERELRAELEQSTDRPARSARYATTEAQELLNHFLG